MVRNPNWRNVRCFGIVPGMCQRSSTFALFAIAFAVLVLLSLPASAPATADEPPKGSAAEKARVEMVAGMQALSDGDFDIAVALLTRAVSSGELNREHLSDSYYWLSRALIRLNEGLLALQQVKRAVRAKPENVKALREQKKRLAAGA